VFIEKMILFLFFGISAAYVNRFTGGQYYLSCSPRMITTMQYRPPSYPMNLLMNQPVALGYGGADQRMMQVCSCYIGMFKIPHTEKPVYDGEGKPDCDRVMATNNLARSAIPVNLRPPGFGDNPIVSNMDSTSEQGLCMQKQKLYLFYNTNLEQAGGGNLWNIFSSKMKDVPNCDEHGNFAPFQCNRRRSQCWCVTRYGMELPGSRQNQAGMFTYSNLELSCYNNAQGRYDPLAPVNYDVIQKRVDRPVYREPTSESFLGLFGSSMQAQQERDDQAPLRDAFGGNANTWG